MIWAHGANALQSNYLLMRDFRLAFRGLLTAKGRSLTMVATFGMALVANLTLFSLFDAIQVRDLPVSAPEQLVIASAVDAKGFARQLPVTVFDAIASEKQSFQQVALQAGGISLPVEIGGHIRSLPVAAVTPEYFDVLRLRPAVGRFFTRAELGANLDALPIAVASYSFWTSVLKRDGKDLGGIVRVGGTSFSIVGVLPAGFEGLHIDAGVDLLIPLGALRIAQGAPSAPIRGSHLVGRRRPEVAFSEARADLERLWTSLNASSSSERNANVSAQLSLVVESGRNGISRLRAANLNSLTALTLPTIFLLVAACANVAGLYLVRAVGRRSELALQVSLGGSRLSLARQFGIEAVLLMALSFAIAVSLAKIFALGIATALWASPTPLALDMLPQGASWLALTLTLAVVAFLVGSIPAVLATRTLESALTTHTRSHTAHTRLPSQFAIGMQVMLSLALIVSAGGLVKSFVNLRSIDLGFETRNRVWTVFIPQPNGYRQLNDGYYEQLEKRLTSITGIRTVSYSRLFPAALSAPVPTPMDTITSRQNGGQHDVAAYVETASPQFFETFGVRILEGRSFRWDDRSDTVLVAIVNESLRNAMFPGEEAIGRSVDFGPQGKQQTFSIIGVAEDSAIANFRNPSAPVLFRPWAQAGAVARSPYVGIEFDRPVDSNILQAVRDSVQGMGVEYVPFVYPMEDESNRVLARERIAAASGVIFAVAAALLAAMGIYSQITYESMQRRKEAALRLALGATETSVVLHSLRTAATSTLVGLGLGIPVSIGTASLVRSLLFGIDPTSPTLIMIAVLTLALIALAAAAFPAIRATRFSLATVLRES